MNHEDINYENFNRGFPSNSIHNTSKSANNMFRNNLLGSLSHRMPMKSVLPRNDMWWIDMSFMVFHTLYYHDHEHHQWWNWGYHQQLYYEKVLSKNASSTKSCVCNIPLKWRHTFIMSRCGNQKIGYLVFIVLGSNARAFVYGFSFQVDPCFTKGYSGSYPLYVVDTLFLPNN